MAQVMIDIAGTELTTQDRELLAHPDVNGLILFTRNYVSISQLEALCADAREAAGKPLMIAVDHEGGRVQRFRQGFSAIPAMGRIAQVYTDTDQRATAARELGWLMAAEVQAVGIDISFAPVLDINDVSEVIGDRAFSNNAAGVTSIAAEFIAGMHEAGMAATGKHFPGHGSVVADSHIAIPVDDRDKQTIFDVDIPPFRELSKKLQGIMPAHVVYSAVDEMPAGFSNYWLQTVLREQLGFDGMIFSDDLSMHGATVVGDMKARSDAAFNAGCDMVLVCNDRAGANALLAQSLPDTSGESRQRFERMLMSKPVLTLQELQKTERWQQVQRFLD
ncbi:beta-N-acetylhexosaminidase [Idiomarina sp.]|uniref:beta-N-acetylhexosaminidase n=1 Tax=Idiomarina sp. TaxID=1874361 RepID=UPI0025C02E1A|nr:beta-N-acetylhexosaminidase [Idiomarina sp.]